MRTPKLTSKLLPYDPLMPQSRAGPKAVSKWNNPSFPIDTRNSFYDWRLSFFKHGTLTKEPQDAKRPELFLQGKNLTEKFGWTKLFWGVRKKNFFWGTKKKVWRSWSWKVFFFRTRKKKLFKNMILKSFFSVPEEKQNFERTEKIACSESSFLAKKQLKNAKNGRTINNVP